MGKKSIFITPLPPIDEIPEIEPNPQYQSDFPDDYTDLFETLPESEITPTTSPIYPDFSFDLNDQIPQGTSTDLSPSPVPEIQIFDPDEPSPLFQSQESIADNTSTPPPPPEKPPENLPIIRTIPENEIDKILDHTWYNGKVHYKLLFKNPELPRRYFQGPWVPQSVIDRYFNDMKQDLPYKKFYPPKVRKV